jgi:hypothetical protein
VKRKGNNLTFNNSVGETIISSRLINSNTSNGTADDEFFTVKSLLTDKLSHTMDDERIAALNSMAGLSALIRENRTNRLFLACALSCSDDEMDAWDLLYKPLLIFSSFFQVELLLATLKNLFGMDDVIDVPKRGEHSYWGMQDFKHAEDFLNKANLLSSFHPR